MKATPLLCCFLALTACVESRYRSNLQHAAVTRWTHLSRADFEQAVRLVSDATRQPIIGITTDHARSDTAHLHVITGYDDSSMQSWTGFHLEKRTDGWHITDHGEISHFVADMRLSGSL